MWSIIRVEGGWQVQWDGRNWGEVKPTKARAREYLEKSRTRYPNGVGALVRPKRTRRRRGGPYVYSLPDGEWQVPQTGEIDAKSKKDARQILTAWIRRRRLPTGTDLRQK